MDFLKSFNFNVFNANSSIFIHHNKKQDNITIISIYMDNFLLASNKYKILMNSIKKKLKVKYNVKDLTEVKKIIS